MTKNLTTINQFVDESIGEWKSIRSTHTLAFQEFENSTSQIFIRNINSKNKKVIEIFKNYKLSLNLESIAISIKWQAFSDWEEDNINEGDETILIFLPKDENSGIVLRNKGYTESFISSSNYFIDEQKNLHIKTIYKSTVSEERISFLSTHIRSRFSIIRSLENNSVIQTSHTSEIRNLASLKD
ncbi:phycobiliprotein lyase [Prochlorococcus marinus XMU1414]|uniref:Chromophore lyase CpcS/CpeS n=1 Tax=Prochlorococcus marinus XMU1424 TaxID=2774497 RepID=A0A9D9BW38_PROMR|nr:phycobiliprotein lyase [Prochlorococcus marinus]MBO8227607.1 phycobiliprotein lyase [Prochlorococcus marinus XMU1414]MBW3045121.1 phycobiliprotein lyase [Prochlorococcus marinus str. MU1414]MCR8532614.1 phycobiliprotein lyase [Prochlorococcus marinus XMU1420]MCR8536561.1 phycobiliprotein lyase [Prochlorococcus marinus XMU1424]